MTQLPPYLNVEKAMTRLPRIGVDVDGILANFQAPCIAAVEEILKELGLPPVNFEVPGGGTTLWPDWHWPWIVMRQAGMPEETLNAVMTRTWEAISQSVAFWATLPGYPTARSDIHYLRTVIEHGWDVYFITQRMGVTAKFQTEAWLCNMGIKVPFVPTVLIVQDSERTKPALAAALGLDAFIEDKAENMAGMDCRRYLLSRPWNQAFDSIYVGMVRVHSVKDMLELELEILNR